MLWWRAMNFRRLFAALLFCLLIPAQALAAIGYRASCGCTGTTSCTTGSGCVAGDALIAFTFRDGNVNAPSLPAGWTTIENSAGGSNNGSLFAWKIAAGGAEASGTFSSATSLVIQGYSGVDTTNLGITGGGSGHAVSGGSGTNVRYPGATAGLSFTHADGTSWIVSCAARRSVDGTALSAITPTGLSAANQLGVLDSTDDAECYDSNGGISSFADYDASVGGTSSGWRGQTVELLEAAAATDTPYDPFGMSGVFGQ